jgi:hypothetical protein
MLEPTLEGIPLSQVSSSDLKEIISGLVGFVRESEFDDEDVGRRWAMVLLQERGQ